MIDVKTVSVIIATITLGPPQAAPMALGILNSGLTETLILLSVGHLGSALVLFLFFQLFKPVIERLKGLLGSIWQRIARRKEASREGPSSQPFGIMTPGQKYFFLGAVAFVFAFGSFIGVAATQAVGMRRSRAFAAVMIGCTISVLFWGMGAFYLSKAVDPMIVTVIFILLAVSLVWRGKILENRIVTEIKSLGANGLRVLILVAEEVSQRKIAAETQLRIEEIGSILEDLYEKGYISSAGQGLYRISARGFDRLKSIQNWIEFSLGLGPSDEVKK